MGDAVVSALIEPGQYVVFLDETLKSHWQCLSPPRRVNGYKPVVGEAWWNAGGGDNFMVHENGDKLQPGGPIGFNADYNSFTA